MKAWSIDRGKIRQFADEIASGLRQCARDDFESFLAFGHKGFVVRAHDTVSLLKRYTWHPEGANVDLTEVPTLFKLLAQYGLVALCMETKSGVTTSITNTKIEQAINEIAELLTAKGNDYGNENLLVFGYKGVVVRCYDKVSRLKQLVWHDTEQKVKDESIKDTFRDLVGYGLLALCMKELWVDDDANDTEQGALTAEPPSAVSDEEALRQTTHTEQKLYRILWVRAGGFTESRMLSFDSLHSAVLWALSNMREGVSWEALSGNTDEKASFAYGDDRLFITRIDEPMQNVELSEEPRFNEYSIQCHDKYGADSKWGMRAKTAHGVFVATVATCSLSKDLVLQEGSTDEKSVWSNGKEHLTITLKENVTSVSEVPPSNKFWHVFVADVEKGNCLFSTHVYAPGAADAFNAVHNDLPETKEGWVREPLTNNWTAYSASDIAQLQLQITESALVESPL